jgi:ABC-2 type transport system permease protein
VSLLWPQVVQLISSEVYPPTVQQLVFGLPNIDQLQLAQTLSRLSPSTLFGDAMIGILNPTTRAIDVAHLVFLSQSSGAVIGLPLPLTQSLLLVWPEITSLVAAMIVLFVIAYVVFQRQEVRA